MPKKTYKDTGNLVEIHDEFCDRFVLLTSQKQNIMKLSKYYLIVAIFGAGLFFSCTPESIDDGQNDQQIERSRIRVPQNG